MLPEFPGKQTLTLSKLQTLGLPDYGLLKMHEKASPKHSLTLGIEVYKYYLHLALKSVNMTYLGLFASLGQGWKGCIPNTLADSADVTSHTCPRASSLLLPKLYGYYLPPPPPQFMLMMLLLLLGN